MGFKTFGAETLLAADVNNYLMRQVVPFVANATEQNAIPAPVIGMKCHRTDTNIVMRYDGTTWKVWEATGVVTPASGYTLSAGALVSKSGNIASVTFHITKTDGGTIPPYVTLATIPPEFRPWVDVKFGGGGADGADRICLFMMGASGSLTFQVANAGAPTSVTASASWPTL